MQLRPYQISIHAPVKGATRDEDFSFNYYIISIHAPVKGATSTSQKMRDILQISIHAPVKGATQPGKLCALLWMDFNPRAREGRDQIIA